MASSESPTNDVPAHEQDEHFVERGLIDEHAERSESAEFRRNRKRLIREHGRCWMDTDVCDQDRLEAHHIVEWCMWPKVDPVRLQALLRAFDPHGYSAHSDDALVTPDDIRNLLLLCDRCHRGVGMGAHHLTVATWMARKARRVDEAITAEEAALKGFHVTQSCQCPDPAGPEYGSDSASA